MASPIVITLEVGTSKIVAAFGEKRADGHISVVGLNEYPSSGIRKGKIIDLEKVVTCVRSTLDEMEHSRQIIIREVHLAFSGGDVQTIINRGITDVRGKGGQIDSGDIRRAITEARRVSLPSDREILHTVCQNFCVDGQEGIIHPDGFVGEKLAVDVIVMHTSKVALQNVVRAIQSLRINVSDVMFTGLCSALAVLTPEQKRSGAIVIDIGGGTTSYVVYEGDMVASAGCVGVGGDHVTNDVALAFNIPNARAEILKREHSSTSPDETTLTRTIEIPPELGFSGRVVSLRALNTVVGLRVMEIFERVKAEIDSRGLKRFGAGVILTGGGSLLNGICDTASRIFGLPCSIGKAQNVSGLVEARERPQYAACCGALLYAFRTLAEQEKPRMLNWLKRRFF